MCFQGLAGALLHAVLFWAVGPNEAEHVSICMASSHAYYNEVLPDFGRRTTGQQLCSDIANPELILDRCWFHSAVGCYLAQGDEEVPRPNARCRLSTYWFIMVMGAMPEALHWGRLREIQGCSNKVAARGPGQQG